MSGSVALSFARQTVDPVRRHAAAARVTEGAAGMADFGSALGRACVDRKFSRDDRETEAPPGPEARGATSAPVPLPELAAVATPARPAGNTEAASSAREAGETASPSVMDEPDEPRAPEHPHETRRAVQGRHERPASEPARPATIVADVRMETHFEPVTSPRAVAPIAAHMMEALPVGDAPSAEAREAAVSTGRSTGVEMRAGPGAGGIVRVLKIELRPADLGVLHVSMRILSGCLEISVQASSADTASWIEGNREALAQAIRSGGQDFSNVDIRILSHDPGSAAEALAAAAMRPSPAERGTGRAGDQRQAGSDDRQRIRRTQDERDPDGDLDRDRDVYL